MRLRPHKRSDSTTEGEGGPSKFDEAEEEDVGSLEQSGGHQDVLWEVGSVSDGSDAQEKERRGVGGGYSGGERRGLLVDEEDDAEDGDRTGTSKQSRDSAEADPFVDEEGFGEFEGVAKHDSPSPGSRRRLEE